VTSAPTCAASSIASLRFSLARSRSSAVFWVDPSRPSITY
jgi:hypothetical protein